MLNFKPKLSCEQNWYEFFDALKTTLVIDFFNKFYMLQ